MSLLDNASLVLTPNAYKEGKLYSVIPSNGNGDFTATRATTATRVNADGLVDLVPYNLVQYSEQFENAAWTRTTSTVTPNQGIAPDGTLTMDLLTFVSAGTFTTQGISVTNGATYTFSVWLATQSGTQTVEIGNVNLGVWQSVTVTTTPQRFEVTQVASATTRFPGIRCTAAYSIFAWGAQLVEGTSARDYLRTETRLNIPRVDYSLGGCPNILLEPQRTNLLLNTVFSGSGAAPTSWTQAVGTGTSLLTTSTLGAGAQACSQSATAQRPFLAQNFTLLANTTYSYSIYIESISGALTNDNVLLPTGLPVGATISYFANGVSVSNTAVAVVGRLSITIVVSSTGGSVAFRCGIGTSSNQTGTLLFSRPQLEAGAYSTSFIPTTTASVTRNADTITRNNIFTNGLITAAGGTWFVELRNNVAKVRDNSGAIILGVDGNNCFRIRNVSPLLSRVTIDKNIAGVSSNLYTTTTDTVKMAIKWNGSTGDVFVNGVKVVSATAFTFTALQEITSSAGIPLYINEMALFPTPLTDAQCIAITQ